MIISYTMAVKSSVERILRDILVACYGKIPDDYTDKTQECYEYINIHYAGKELSINHVKSALQSIK